MSYRPDGRSVAELTEQLLIHAAQVAVPELEPRADASRATWRDVLEADDVSFGLVRELIDAHHGLLDHFAELPQRAQRYWLEQTCEIEALDTLAAWAVVVAEVADGAGPVLVPSGTQLKGPKDGEGNGTTFATTDNLVATGATVSDVRSYARWPDVTTASDQSVDDTSIVPFGDLPGTHELIFCSSVWAFEQGSLHAVIDFEGAAVDVSALAELTWTYSMGDGEEGITTAVEATPSQLVFELIDACRPQPVQTGAAIEPHCYLRASASAADFASVAGFSFDGVSVWALRNDLRPDGAFYNDGIVDIEREFKPYGDVPRRGDSFYLQSDEALSKPLADLDIYLTPLRTGEYDLLFMVLLFAIVDAHGYVPPPPKIEWQIRREGDWETLTEADTIANVTTIDPGRDGSPAADLMSLAGTEGRFIRAFLSGGDFGWDKYQQDLVAFANAVAGSGGGSMPIAPKPPALRHVMITYETEQVDPDCVVAVTGFSRRDITSGSPFVHPVSTQLGLFPAAAVHVGLVLPAAALGQTLSFWFDVDSTAACAPSTGADLSQWEVWNGVTWNKVAVSDATDSLRTSGLVRFVAPLVWPEGCPEAGSLDGRWFRLATNQPDRIGRIEAVLPDAVRVVAEPNEHGDVASLLAPEAESIKGPSNRIDGVKKLINPVPGQSSRSAETDDAYVARAPQVVRTRNRLVQPVDYELDIRAAFPEVAFVSCLPHFDGTEAIAPGHVGLVVIPATGDAAPLPSADLVTRVERSVENRSPLHATVAVHCPQYRRVNVDASIVLSKGQAALTARAEIGQAIDDWLHPINRPPSDMGTPVYRSEIISLIEGLPIVDRITRIDLDADDDVVARGPNGVVERVDPPSPRRIGMVVSGSEHQLELVEQLT